MSGSETAAPFWGQGPIQDGEAVAAVEGVLFTTSAAILPDGDDLTEQTEHGTLTRKFSNDLVAVRIGAYVYAVSNNRIHVLDEQGRRIRQMGLTVPQVTPGVLPMGAGPITGVTRPAYTWLAKGGGGALLSESPLKILPAVVARNATIGVGGGEQQPGSIYGDSNATGYWALKDDFNVNVYANMPDGTYTLEALARMDPEIKIQDLREQVFDRGVKGGSANTWFWGHEGQTTADDVQGDQEFTYQFAGMFTGIPSASNEKMLASIGPGGANTANGDPANPIVVTLDRVDANNAKVRLYVSSGPTIASGWATTLFTTQLQIDTPYNFVLRFDGQNYNLFINGVKDATTATSGPARKAPGNWDRLILGGGYSEAEPDYRGGGTITYTKWAPEARWYLCRFWQRALPDGDIGALSNVWFDTTEDARFGTELKRFYRFSTDEPFAKPNWFHGQTTLLTSGISFGLFRNQRNGAVDELRSAHLSQQWAVDNASARILTFYTSTPGTQFTSPLQALWTRIGNGSLLVTAGSNLIYYAANERLGTLTPALPADPQGWAWYTFEITTAGQASTPTVSCLEFWINGIRYFSGGVAVDRDNGAEPDAADVAGWRGYGSITDNTQIDVHLAEFRGWNSAKYAQSSDFEWLTRRVPENLWSTLVYYYQMFRVDGSGDIPNDGTADVTAEALDTVSPAALVTVSSVPMPTPPSPDIIAARFYRTPTLLPRDFNNEDELEALRRISMGLPFNFVGEVPRGTTVFQDSVPNEAMGYEARAAGGYAPRHLKGVFAWGGILCGFGDEFNPLRIYTADVLDRETFEPGGYIDVPSRDFEVITAAVEADSGAWIFGPNGGVVYRGGSPGRSDPTAVGGGIGCQTARCIATNGSTVFVFGNAGLWAFNPDGSRAEIGRAVIDKLPADPAQARLAVAGDSLYVIDETSTTALRWHAPTASWDVLEGIGMWGATMRGGTTYFALQSGFFAMASGNGDDLRPGQTLTGVVGSGSTSSTLVSTGTPFPAATAGTDDGCRGQQIRLIRAADGTTEYKPIRSNTTSVVTLAPGYTWDGAAPVSGDSWAMGAFETLVDTGWMPGNQQIVLRSLDLEILSGTWRAAGTAEDTTGDPDDDLDGSLYAFSSNASGRLGIEDAGRYARAAVQSLLPEDAVIVAAIASVEGTTSEAPPDA